MKEFDELLAIMHKLRLECPWDKEQDLKSLRKYLLEESYECVGAIDEISTHGIEPLIEELGDVLLQVVFQAEILSEETKEQTIKIVLDTLKEKLIRRHPHVFGDQKASNSKEVLKRWDEIKKSEKPIVKDASQLDGITRSHTALQLAQKLGDRSKKIDFDWGKPSEVWKQFESEVEELKKAKTPDEKEHELGDVFFSLVQWARHEKLDAEVVLAKANARFERRFKKMEEFARKKNQNFATLSAPEKEKLWQEAKLSEKS
ncbi:MAG: MazG family protein [Bacteriovoracaceae bacterium]|nr:MazG family protein [Bacteriovoracaceae bacterium]